MNVLERQCEGHCSSFDWRRCQLSGDRRSSATATLQTAIWHYTYKNYLFVTVLKYILLSSLFMYLFIY